MSASITGVFGSSVHVNDVIGGIGSVLFGANDVATGVAAYITVIYDMYAKSTVAMLEVL